jgi:hypothetical protein
MRSLILVLLALTVAACATPYQEMKRDGGVLAVRISEDVVQIRAQGNGYTDADVIQRFALRKAAETTLAYGYDLFQVGEKEDRTKRDKASYRYGGSGLWASLAFDMDRPGQSLMIKMLKGPKPDPLPRNMYDAREVTKYLSMGPSPDPRN